MTTDPRPTLAQALDQTDRPVSRTPADQLSRPTPCTADAVAHARADVDTTWGDDALLDADVTVPWAASTPGRAALTMWTQELITHAWDLATATGRPADLDPQLGYAALDIAQRYIPSEPRGGGIPFAPVVPVPDDADVYTRLAAYLGRGVRSA